ncbi:hypothetical protein H6P81_011611 [Aristolochia fimbriata]|uniref:C2 NT-type domain-containing protein n=1 Tax=Aristolochia fimbriata TaxID=158543 RepID=A0AAV7EV00_ARIFI|nr:hypothetical protein H6P81_011611 [Aristolochia fimbriata]
MSRIAKFKPEKTKVKVVFRLQFHATQIPQPGWDKLFVSFIPVETGKTTAKTTKANVRNGNCKWSDPIYETARLLQDVKTKHFEEKIYKLVVAMGSSRSSILGEAIINLADFADASKPLSAALPLQGSNLGPVLHVTVQLLTSKTGFREFEQQREVREKRFRMPSGPSAHDECAEKVSSSAAATNDHIDKVNSRVRFKPVSMELPSLDGLNEDCADSAVGIDGSSQTSESLYAEKHDISSTHEVDSLKSTTSGDLVGFSPNQGPQPEKGDLCESRLVAQGSSDWVHGWSSDYSMDCDLSAAYEENSRLRVSLEIAEASIQELKLEVSSLQCLADQLGSETQRVSQQLASEIASGQDLAREVFVLKSEWVKLKDDYRQQVHSGRIVPKIGREVFQAHEYHLDGTAVMREKITELFNELEKSKAECEGLVSKMNQMEVYYESLIHEMEVGQKQMMDELHSLRNQHSNCLYTISTFESQTEKLHLDMNEQFLMFSKEKQELESLNKELEKRALSSEAALKRLRWNYSLATDHLQKDLELLSFQVLSMFETHENLARQAFSEGSQLYLQDYLQNEERENLTEEFGSKVGGIQPEIELSRKSVLELSSNVDGALSYPKAILKSRLHYQELDVTLPKDRVLIEEPVKMLTERSFSSYEKLLEQDVELSGVYVQNVELGVYSDILEENLHQSSSNIKLLKEKLDGLERQLKHEDESRELLTLKLQSVLHEMEVLRDSEVKCISRCNDLMSENCVLEAELQSISAENTCLSQKLAECEGIISECRIYESKYKVCTEEKRKLETVLQENTLGKSCLQNELTTAHGELKMLKAKFSEQSSVKDYLEKTLDFLEEKLGALMSKMASYLEQIDPQILANSCSQPDMQNMNLITITRHLEEVQQRAFELILKVSNEKKDVEEQRDIARESLSSMEYQLRLLKEKYESEIEDLQTKLDASNLNSEMLQLELKAIADRLRTSTGAEARHAVENRELELKLAALETNLQLLTNEKEILMQKILALESVNGDITDKLKRSIETEESHITKNRELLLKLAELEMEFSALKEELEKTKLAFTHCAEEGKTLLESLQASNAESVQLTYELTGLKERLGCTQDELQAEKDHRGSLEARIRDLTLQLNKNHEELLSLKYQKAEIVQLEQHVSGLESENTKLKFILLNCEDSRAKAVEDASLLRLHVAELESSLQSMHECSLAADIEVLFTKNQFQAGLQQLHNQLMSLERSNQELHQKYLDVVTSLNKCMDSEAQYKEENARLLEVLESLKCELVALEVNKLQALDDGRTPPALVEEYEQGANERQDHEVECLKDFLMALEKEIDDMRFLKNELEITITVLQSKLDEQHALIILQQSKLDELRGQITLQQQCSDELIELRRECSEIANRLSEQALKTEEFKNLSLHLRELKDKAEAECLQAREKRENEGPMTSAQESLRIAFIREQCESKLQDLRGQLYASKKHGEEMLLKLQGALDEIENRKKCEASLAKRNADLSVKILELENELQTVLSEKREKANAYDRVMAELECSMISLECCKEENIKLETSLQECIEVRAKISAELDLIRGARQGSSYQESIQESDHCEPGLPKSFIPQLSAVDLRQVSVTEDNMLSNQQSIPQNSKVSIESNSALEVTRKILVGQGSWQKDLKLVPAMEEHNEEKNLKHSIDRMHKELERFKDEISDSLMSPDKHNMDLDMHGLQRELLQLHLANERLGTIFPLFKEFSGSGNALERVLALEIELAEALQSKKKSSIQFQSSFLKQHNDDQAVFQSFRDINELIKDMLELKRRNGLVESELKEMHERYSQLSLQFAEVEGERQKLVMTLKNIRLPKKS